MSDEIIRVGDLVMITKLMPCGHGSLGFTFVVQYIIYEKSHCHTCGDSMFSNLALYSYDEGAEIYRLKKINPPPIEESVVTKEGIEA